jgi:hypothetical protein
VYVPRKKSSKTSKNREETEEQAAGGAEAGDVREKLPADDDGTDDDEQFPGLMKWARYISEHIPFENLPEATGNYERLRTTLARSKNESK